MIRDYDMLSRMQQIISQAPTWKKKLKTFTLQFQVCCIFPTNKSCKHFLLFHSWSRCMSMGLTQEETPFEALEWCILPPLCSAVVPESFPLRRFSSPLVTKAIAFAMHCLPNMNWSNHFVFSQRPQVEQEPRTQKQNNRVLFTTVFSLFIRFYWH